jgi:putative intracellular protease/amidase
MDPPRLDGRSVLVIVPPVGFDDAALQHAKELFEAAGARVEIASTVRDAVRGTSGLELAPDCTLLNVDPRRYAVVLLAGGKGARVHFWDNQLLHALLRMARDAGARIGAIGLSPAVLARAGLLLGIRATVCDDPLARRELERGGAHHLDQHVVADHGIVTAGSEHDAGALAQALMRAAPGPARVFTRQAAAAG